MPVLHAEFHPPPPHCCTAHATLRASRNGLHLWRCTRCRRVACGYDVTGRAVVFMYWSHSVALTLSRARTVGGLAMSRADCGWCCDVALHLPNLSVLPTPGRRTRS